MICALTVRKLKPGTFDQFKQAFRPDEGGGGPDGWIRFNMLRSLADENEVITFGFFDGTLEELRASQDGSDYDRLVQEIAPIVESVGTDALFEVVVDTSMDRSQA